MNILDLLKKSKPSSAPTELRTGEKVEENKPKSRDFVEGLVSTKDIIAPSALEVDTDFIKIGNKYYRTVFTVINRRFVEINWLSTLINFDASLAVSMYIYPSDGKEILDDLRRKITEMEAELTTDIQRGRIVNPATQAKLEDALNLQADLVKGEERFFQMGLYVTIGADSRADLDRITKNLESAMGALMVLTKKTNYDSENAFITTLPLGQDRLNLTRNMDTTSLATTFPFVSSDLSDDKGIMYGINEHNGSLVIFDRFSMPNYNSVVFATAGAGKSYMIKLEVMRSLMMGTEIIVIDPENEYRSLSESVGGQYIAFGYGEDSKINPFDLSLVVDEGENALNSKVLSLHKLLKIMLGELDPIEESILDRAVVDAYKMKGITPDPETQTKEPPLVEDLYKSLIGMEDQKAQSIAARLEKYIKGSFAGIFNQKTTVDLKNEFVVFGIRNLEDSLRPVAMHIILDYIWTVVKQELRRRILVVDEAWYMMQFPDSAAFLRGIVKRGRKYYLGVTTITQDVDDFLETAYGREIVTNSSIQILLKQHSAAIDQIGEVFYLSEGEKQLLLTADKGEGIFFAGQNHVAIRVVASEEEHKLITSNPEEVLRAKKEAEAAKRAEMKSPEVEVEVPVFKAITNHQIPSAPNNDQSPNIKLQTEEKKDSAVLNPPVTTEVVTSPLEKGGNTDAQNPSLTPPLTKEIKEEVVAPEIMVTPSNESSKGETKTEQSLVQNPSVTNSNPSPPAAVSPNDLGDSVVEMSPQEILQKRIAEMEELEKTKVEDHKEKMKIEEEEKTAKEEEKKKLAGTLGNFGSLSGGLPKYQDLFVNKNKLPPLPPLPSFAPAGATADKPPVEENPFKMMKTEVVTPQAPKPPVTNKPVFMPKTEEVKIPQPPQFQKNKPVFEPPASEPPTPKGSGEPKMDYDKLFGNGIV
jgi:hypothetical protein